MPRQQFESRRLAQYVLIDEAVFTTVIEAARAARNQETGGILIGRYDGSARAVVEHAATAPPDSTHGYDWFERGTEGVEAILQQHWDAPVRRYYVGEWHFHPAPDGAPSPRDIEQMFEVAEQRRYQCNQPILIIVSPDPDGSWLIRVFLFAFDNSIEELTVAREEPAESP